MYIYDRKKPLRKDFLKTVLTFIHVAKNVAKSKIVLTFIHVAQNVTKSERQRKNRNTF